ncbi:MAG: 50S ribosomal protein L4 [Deferribacterales bacterium]|nr:50S ribosomal protein L4 [Deferribacterales bacterium]
MAKVDVFNVKNAKVGEAQLHDAILDYPVNTALIHEVVKMQLACRRAGTHSTKTKGLVSGGGKKPWKQKGTGRARCGSNRSPLWRGGGTIFGPLPRDYSYSMPKKKVKNALKAALHAKFDDGAVVVLDNLFVENGKTKEAIEILKAFEADRSVLFVVDAIDEKVARAFGNIPYADILHVNGLNVYDVVNSRKIIILQSALPLVEKAAGICSCCCGQEA